MSQEKAIVLMSGGLNSAVAASLASSDYLLFGLHVQYGQNAATIEAESFEKQADHFKMQDRLVLEMPHLAAIREYARRSPGPAAESLLPADSANHDVPGLLGTLIQAAFGCARAIGAKKVFIGVSEGPTPAGTRAHDVRPDHSREYVQLCNYQLAVASEGRAVLLDAPLIDLSRAEIIQLGRRVGTPFELTWSCQSSGAEPCGICPGCATRNRGFLDSAVPDPVLLQTATR